MSSKAEFLLLFFCVFGPGLLFGAIEEFNYWKAVVKSLDRKGKSNDRNDIHLA